MSPPAELLRRLQAERARRPKASAGRGRKAVVQSEKGEKWLWRLSSKR